MITLKAHGESFTTSSSGSQFVSFFQGLGACQGCERAIDQAVYQYDLCIRVGDALHLAIAAASGFTLVTLDATTARAAPLPGVPVEALG